MLDAEHAAASLPPASTEDETLLPTSELDSLKEAFYKRYHIRPEPRQFPSDRLLSKLSRQLYRGQLEVMDLWTVRSLTFQRTHSQKRRKVGDGLYLQEDDTEEDMSKTWLAYLMKLETYLLALAIVGCRPRDPPPTAPESLAANSLDYVQVPYDTLFRYYARCQDLAYCTTDSKRLSVLQHLDVEEGAVVCPNCGRHVTGIGDPCSAPRAGRALDCGGSGASGGWRGGRSRTIICGGAAAAGLCRTGRFCGPQSSRWHSSMPRFPTWPLQEQAQ